jgi:GNAT superfamily N-acetyltransferase
MSKYTFEWIPGGLARSEYVEEMAEFYSHHYGWWGKESVRERQRVKSTPARVQGLLKSADSRIALARFNDELVGYAIALQTKVPYYGMVSWVTQFVVHEDHRRKNVGKRLLFTIWGFSDHKALGPRQRESIRGTRPRKGHPQKSLANPDKTKSRHIAQVRHQGDSLYQRIGGTSANDN